MSWTINRLAVAREVDQTALPALTNKMGAKGIYSTKESAFQAALSAFSGTVSRVVVPATAPTWAVNQVLTAGMSPLLVDAGPTGFDTGSLLVMLSKSEPTAVLHYAPLGARLTEAELELYKEVPTIGLQSVFLPDNEHDTDFTVLIGHLPPLLTSGGSIHSKYDDLEFTSSDVVSPYEAYIALSVWEADIELFREQSSATVKLYEALCNEYEIKRSPLSSIFRVAIEVADAHAMSSRINARLGADCPVIEPDVLQFCPNNPDLPMVVSQTNNTLLLPPILNSLQATALFNCITSKD